MQKLKHILIEGIEVRSMLCCRKFNSMVVASTFALAMATIMGVGDTVIAGFLLDDSAISAINVVQPLYLMATFLSGMVSFGAGFLYAKEIGACNKKEADHIYGMSVIVSLLLGAFLAVFMFFGKSVYFRILAVSDDIESLANGYYYFLIPAIAIYPIRMVLSEMITAEGDEGITSVSFFLQFAGNIFLSIWFCHMWGIAGIALGTFTGTMVALLVNCIHYFKKSNTLHFCFYFNWKLFGHVLLSSLADSLLYLYMAITDFVLNIVIVINYGEFYLPVLGVAMTVVEFTIFFDGIGTGFAPLVNVYLGEKNYGLCRKLMNHIMRLVVKEGLIMAVIMFAGAPLIMRLFTIEDAELYVECLKSVRTLAFLMPAAAIILPVISLYNISGHEIATSAIEGIQQVVIVIIFAVLFSNIFGLNGIWLSFVAAGYLTILMCVLYLPYRWKEYKFPWFLPEDEPGLYTLHAMMTAEKIRELLEQVQDLLTQNKIAARPQSNILSAVEDLGQMMIAQNPSMRGRITILSEWTFRLEEGELMVRFDGNIIDLQKALPKESAIMRMKEKGTIDMESLISTGLNRIIIRFIDRG